MKLPGVPELEGCDCSDLSDEQIETLSEVAFASLAEESIANIRKVMEQRAERPEILPAVPIPYAGHRLYLYANFERKLASFVWDSRLDASVVHGFIHHPSDGAELLLVAMSEHHVYNYPVRVGDRINVPLTEDRAWQVSAELLQKIEREKPEAFAEATARYDSREDAIRHCADEALELGEPDLVEVTAGMLDGIRRQQEVNFKAVESARKLGSDADLYSMALAPYMRHQFATNAAWKQNVLSPQEAMGGLQVLDRFDRCGQTLAPEWWARMIEDASYCSLSNTIVSVSVGDAHYALEFVAIWIGLDIKLFDDRVRIGAMVCAMLSRAEASSMIDLQRREPPARIIRTRPIYMWHGEHFAEIKPVWDMLMRVLQSEKWQNEWRAGCKALHELAGNGGRNGQEGGDASGLLYNVLDRVLLSAMEETHARLRGAGAAGAVS